MASHTLATQVAEEKTWKQYQINWKINKIKK